MKKIFNLLLLLLSISIAACGGVMKQYKKTNVEILSVRQLPIKTTEIVYKPMLESMYYSPGANHRQENGRTKVTLVRCKIDKKCPVDVVAKNAGQGQWKIIIPSEQNNIDLIFSDGEINFQ